MNPVKVMMNLVFADAPTKDRIELKEELKHIPTIDLMKMLSCGPGQCFFYVSFSSLSTPRSLSSEVGE